MGKGRHTIKVNKRGRKGQGGRHNKKRKTDEAGWDIEEGKGKRGNWAPSERKNDLFVEYYRNTFGFSDAEWTEFSESLTRDLPTTFRITAHSYFAAALREKLTTYFQPKLHNVDVGSELLPNIMQFEPLSWYHPHIETDLSFQARFNFELLEYHLKLILLHYTPGTPTATVGMCALLVVHSRRLMP